MRDARRESAKVAAVKAERGVVRGGAAEGLVVRGGVGELVRREPGRGRLRGAVSGERRLAPAESRLGRERRERRAAVLVFVSIVEGRCDRGQLDARAVGVWALVGFLRAVRGGGLGGVRVGPRGGVEVDGGAGTLGQRGVRGGEGALVGAGLEAAVRGRGTGHAAGRVVDLLLLGLGVAGGAMGVSMGG